MEIPKYTIGQTVYLLPVVNVTVKIRDRLWDNDLKPKSGYRYQIEKGSTWLPEDCFVSLEEMPEYLEQTKDDSDPSDRWTYSDDILDRIIEF